MSSFVGAYLLAGYALLSLPRPYSVTTLYTHTHTHTLSLSHTHTRTLDPHTRNTLDKCYRHPATPVHPPLPHTKRCVPPTPEDVVPVLVHTEASYKLGIPYDDEVTVGVRNENIDVEKGKLVQSYAVFSKAHGGAAAATGNAIILMCRVGKGGKLERAPCPQTWI